MNPVDSDAFALFDRQLASLSLLRECERGDVGSRAGCRTAATKALTKPPARVILTASANS